MSCFIVSNDLINVLVSAMLKFNIIDSSECCNIGKKLIRSNIYSYNYRYSNDKPIYKALQLYKFKSITNYSNAQIYKFCKCYNYQCCEYKSWEKSQSFKLIKSLMQSLGNFKDSELENLKWDIWF